MVGALGVLSFEDYFLDDVADLRGCLAERGRAWAAAFLTACLSVCEPPLFTFCSIMSNFALITSICRFRSSNRTPEDCGPAEAGLRPETAPNRESPRPTLRDDCSLLFAKHSLQYTGLSPLGRNGTSQCLRQSAQVAPNSCVCPPPLFPSRLKPDPLLSNRCTFVPPPNPSCGWFSFIRILINTRDKGGRRLFLETLQG